MDNTFHSVDPKSIENVTLQDIQNGNIFPEEVLDYSTPIFVEDRSIPESRQDTWWIVNYGYVTANET